MLRLIHIVLDEKFIDSFISKLDTISNCQSRYIINSEFNTFKYLKDRERVECIADENLVQVLNKAENYDVLILHSLAALPFEYIISIPKKIRVIWFAWGWDIYQTSTIRKGIANLVNIDLYEPLTSKLIKGHKSFKYYLKILKYNLFHVKSQYLKIKHSFHKSEVQHLLENAIKRIDYCSTIVPFEYQLLKKNCSFFQAKQLNILYGFPDFESLFSKYKSFGEKSNNILIGNSGDDTNNHIDIFNKLKHIYLNNRRLVVPFNYNLTEYSTLVKKFAINIFQNKVNFVEEFMSYKDYCQLLNNCSHSIFFHSRQQAGSSIYISILLGNKVFLSKKSMFYKYLSAINVTLFTIENELNQKELDEPLPESVAIQNYKIIHSIINDEYVTNRLKEMIITLESEIIETDFNLVMS